MGSGFPFFDIIFLAMVAAFILLRLRAVLGRRTGHQKTRHEKTRNIESILDTADKLPTEPQDGVDQMVDQESKWRDMKPDVSEISQQAQKGLENIQVHDSSFSADIFFSGAAAAFETIIMAFAEGRRDILQPLLDKSVWKSFNAEITKREKVGEKMETTLVSLDKIVIESATIDSRNQAEITTRFQSQQVNILKDKDEKVIDGDRSYVEDVTDLWVFRRDISSPDPNWLLVATLDPE